MSDKQSETGREKSHLVDEGGKAIVESFDLFFLLDPHSLQVRVQLKFHGS